MLSVSKNKKSGGKNTNINGLNYELITNLDSEYTVINTYKVYKIIKFT